MTPHAITIRPATAADAELLSRLFDENKSAEFAVLGLPSEVIAPLVQSQYASRCQSYAASFPNAEQHILQQDDVAVGHMLVWRNGEDLLLVDMAVLKSSRRCGIGTAGLKELLSRAELEGLSVRLTVRSDSPARRLYRRMGFEVTTDHGADWSMRWTAGQEAMHVA